jgi:hypothetical protein
MNPPSWATIAPSHSKSGCNGRREATEARGNKWRSISVRGAGEGATRAPFRSLRHCGRIPCLTPNGALHPHVSLSTRACSLKKRRQTRQKPRGGDWAAVPIAISRLRPPAPAPAQPPKTKCGNRAASSRHSFRKVHPLRYELARASGETETWRLRSVRGAQREAEAARARARGAQKRKRPSDSEKGATGEWIRRSHCRHAPIRNPRNGGEMTTQ